jgi:hypothetical protein
MRVNLFEGSRRIGMLFGVLWIVGCVWYGLSLTPSLRLTYEVRWPGTAPLLVDNCLANAAYESTTRKTADGDRVLIRLCFSAAKADSDRRFIPDYAALARKHGGRFTIERGPDFTAAEDEWVIPYALAEDGKARMAGAQYEAVRRYMESVANSFVLDEHGLERARRVAVVEQLKHTLLTLFGGLAFGWVFMAITGWVVRGFLGIPRGEDERTTERQLSRVVKR